VLIETRYETLKAEKGLTLPGLGGFYLERRWDGCAFTFRPGQTWPALFEWSST